MKSLQELEKLDWHFCRDCLVAAGGKPSPWPCTVCKGDCKGCETKDVTLWPTTDFEFPKRKAVWD